MTKAEVIAVMGKPDTSAANANAEYLVYHLASPKALVVDDNNIPEYFVRLRNGKVDAYGKRGDFQDPTLNLRINE
jgi:hypothetical protein